MNRFACAVVSGFTAFLHALVAPNYVETDRARANTVRAYRRTGLYHPEIGANFCRYPGRCGCPSMSDECLGYRKEESDE